MFDGAIFQPAQLDASALESRESTFPLVLIGERLAADTLDHVYVDDAAAARDATTVLIEGGARRIGAIGLRDAPSARTAHLREHGFHEALAAADLHAEPSHLRYVGPYCREEGYAAMSALLALGDRVDAVFCFSDMLAIGALSRLREEGVSVPDEISVIGFDDVQEAAYTYPPLSSVATDTDLTARLAVDALVERIEQPDGPVREFAVPHRVVRRASTRA